MRVASYVLERHFQPFCRHHNYFLIGAELVRHIGLRIRRLRTASPNPTDQKHALVGLKAHAGTGIEVNPESWTQLKGSNEKRI